LTSSFLIDEKVISIAALPVSCVFPRGPYKDTGRSGEIGFSGGILHCSMKKQKSPRKKPQAFTASATLVSLSTLTRLADGFGPGIALLEYPDSPQKMVPPFPGITGNSAINKVLLNFMLTN